MGIQQNPLKEEYEVLAYPKLNHVRASIVHIINRNTHVHRALELGLVLEGEAMVQVDENTFPIEKGSLFFFNANEPHQIQAGSQAGVKIAYLLVASSFCSEYLSCFRNLELLENNAASPRDAIAALPRKPVRNRRRNNVPDDMPDDDIIQLSLL